MIDTPHYVRFTRALAIAATLALPACSSESTSPGDGDASTTGAPVAANPRCTPAKDAPATPVEDDDDAGVVPVADAAPVETPDAGGSPSGPLAPPELPASFA
jgi:hypothetical protein